MDNANLQALGKQVSDLQAALFSFEEKLMANERSTFLKTSVEYYRDQTQKARDLYLGVISRDLQIETLAKAESLGSDKKVCCKAPEPAAPVPEQCVQPTLDAEFDEGVDPFAELNSFQV
jgi:hypothetical protein